MTHSPVGFWSCPGHGDRHAKKVLPVWYQVQIATGTGGLDDFVVRRLWAWGSNSTELVFSQTSWRYRW